MQIRARDTWTDQGSDIYALPSPSWKKDINKTQG